MKKNEKPQQLLTKEKSGRDRAAENKTLTE